ISGARKTLSMELFFDTYESGEDVRKPTGEIAKLLVATLNDNGHGKRPPTVRFSWGKADPNPNTGIFVFEWVLEKLTQNFTLFNSGGVPVRATLNVSFKEFVIPKEEIKHKPRRKSFPAQTYTLKTGDTLSGVAADLWNDSSKWRIIAVENKIDNPRLLQTGQTLII
ncbi:MAG: LysM peptidoglycan-binding domain-containing protein, partial [Calditrichae bacterium]|nr:LysM peptidoglycan-binding domain-containing protein [Calditrichia bacterium]